MLLKMSLGGAALILLTAIFRLLFWDRVPKSVFPVLWKIALARLLLPVFLALPGAASLPGWGGAALELVGGGLSTVPDAAVPSGAPGGASPAPAAGGVPLGTILTVLWIAGAAVCAGWFAVAALRGRRVCRRSRPLENADARMWLASHDLTRRVELRTLPGLTTPLTYGVLRPVILVPENLDWGAEAAEYMLCHEYIHIRRFDTLTKLLAAAALCVHWFNPAAWLLWRLLNRDIELACDEAVVRRFGRERRAEYARMLIDMEERRMVPAPLGSHFARSAIEERILSIMKIKKNTAISIILAVALVAVCAGVFTASALAPDKAEEPEGFSSFGAYRVTGVVAGRYFQPSDEDNFMFAFRTDCLGRYIRYDEKEWLPNITAYAEDDSTDFYSNTERLTPELLRELGFDDEEIYTDIDLDAVDVRVYVLGRYVNGEDTGKINTAVIEADGQVWYLEHVGHGPALPVIWELTRLTDEEFEELTGVGYDEYFEAQIAEHRSEQ